MNIFEILCEKLVIGNIRNATLNTITVEKSDTKQWRRQENLNKKMFKSFHYKIYRLKNHLLKYT